MLDAAVAAVCSPILPSGFRAAGRPACSARRNGGRIGCGFPVSSGQSGVKSLERRSKQDPPAITSIAHHVVSRVGPLAVSGEVGATYLESVEMPVFMRGPLGPENTILRGEEILIRSFP